MKLLITGGAGFIGSALVLALAGDADHEAVNVDKLTYAANLHSLDSVAAQPDYSFEQADICDGPEMRRILAAHQPDAVLHLAAETHVDRSIEAPSAFVQTNIVGTHRLLLAALDYWRGLTIKRAAEFRFLHVSTDEVYGTIAAPDLFTEKSPYAPNSPYAATKAGADHLVRAMHKTYGFPIVMVNSSNNFGPRQYPEKFIPVIIKNSLQDRPIPVYGDGENVRDWLYVEDHVRAIMAVMARGRIGESYNVGGGNQVKNTDMAGKICRILDAMAPHPTGRARATWITYIEDRPGHDFRYATDTTKISSELDWHPEEDFESGLTKTVAWYLDNRTWWDAQGETPAETKSNRTGGA